MDKNSKLYVILGQSILYYGGAQIYYINKKKYLEKLGWTVKIFSFHTVGPIIYSEFNAYRDLIIPELSLPLYYFTASARSRLLGKIESYMDAGSYNEIVIESNWIGSAEWGELLASRLKARHVIYLLSETNQADLSLDFLKYKLDRGELSGISDHVIRSLFQDENEVREDLIHPILAGSFCLSSPSEKEDQVLSNLLYRKLDYTISYYGRIEKLSCKTLSEICDFVKSIKKDVLFIGLGYNNTQELARFEEIVGGAPDNMRIEFVPAMVNVPKSFFELSDVIIASAGCARVAAQQKAFTITVDTEKDDPIGILGITTSYTTSNPNPTNASLQGLLKDILIQNNYRKDDIDISEYEAAREKAVEEFIKFIEPKNEKTYYDFENRVVMKAFNYFTIRMFVFRLLGFEVVAKLRTIKRKLQKYGK